MAASNKSEGDDRALQVGPDKAADIANAMPLRRLFLRRLLLAYVLFAAVVTSLQLYAEYVRIRADVAVTLDFLVKSMTPSAETALWDVQTDLLKSMANGLMEHPVVRFVQILDEDGKVLEQAGVQSPTAASDAGLYRSRALIHSKTDGGTQRIGELRIGSNQSVVLGMLWSVGLTVGMSIAAQLIFLAAVLLLLVGVLVVKPLKLFSDKVGEMILSGVDRTIDLGQVASLEIVTLQNGFNQLVRQVAQSHDVIARQNLELEQRVLERTRALNENQAHLSNIFERANNGIFFADVAGRLIRFNQSLADMLGYHPADFPLGNFLDLSHPQDAENERREFLALRDGAVDNYRLEKRYLDRQGNPVWVDVAVSAIRDDQRAVVNFVGVVVDVSARRRVADAMLDAKNRAEEATKAKSDFLANMSHEIRTPMNAIIGMSHLALKTNLDARQRNYIEKVHRSSVNLLGIINDILDFSKIEAGKLSLECIAFGLDEVMGQLASLLSMKVNDRHVDLHFRVAPGIPNALMGDPLRLGQVLVNLANNAIKFTSEGDIVVGLEANERDETAVELHFWVQDSGIGISPEQRDRLFQSFSQADASTTRKFGGTGLGLTISRTLVEMMGGRIWVDSTLGVGSTFHFTVRLGLQGGNPMKSMFLAEELTGLRVLVADDNPIAREILSATLTSFGMQVQTADNGAQALSRLRQSLSGTTPYALALIDRGMPAPDGMACIRQIHLEYPVCPPCVLVVANGKEEAEATEILSAENGVPLAGILLKPTTPSSLLEVVARALQLKDVAYTRRSLSLQSPVDVVQQLGGARVLLVEDNLLNQELAKELLQQAGIDVVVAENGQQALDILASSADFDGVLMDCQMPVMDGYTATRLLRQNPAWANLPVIAMTANAMAGDREKVLSAGMNDHISKPLVINEMFITIAHWVRPHHNARPPVAPAAIAAPAMPVTPATPALASAPSPASHAVPQSLGSMAGIDSQKGLHYSNGNVRIYQKLLLRFRQGQKAFVAQFTQAQSAANEDRSAAQRLAHTLSSTAGTIGAEALQQAAKKLEIACMQGAHPPAVQTELDAVQRELAVVLGSLSVLEDPAG